MPWKLPELLKQLQLVKRFGVFPGQLNQHSAPLASSQASNATAMVAKQVLWLGVCKPLCVAKAVVPNDSVTRMSSDRVRSFELQTKESRTWNKKNQQMRRTAAVVGFGWKDLYGLAHVVQSSEPITHAGGKMYVLLGPAAMPGFGTNGRTVLLRFMASSWHPYLIKMITFYYYTWNIMCV